MAYLKAAGKAIMNSPKAIRRKLGGQEGPQKHEQLDEDWYHSDDPINAGVSFFVKYLGSADVARTHGPGSTDDAVKAIVHHAKNRGGKLQKVSITVSSKFIQIKDVVKQTKLEELPLYRVSYCTVDPYYDKVFCYISRNHETKKLECHAFLCSKKSKAEAVTLTVAQAFNIAYEKWNEHKRKKEERKKQNLEQSHETDGHIGVDLTSVQPPQPVNKEEQRVSVEATASSITHINIHSPDEGPKPVQEKAVPNPFSNGFLGVKSTITKTISLDTIQMDDEFDMEFTRLAEARSNPHLLEIGDHMTRATSHEEIKEMMRKGDNSTVDDFTRSKSIDDLLLI